MASLIAMAGILAATSGCGGRSRRGLVETDARDDAPRGQPSPRPSPRKTPRPSPGVSASPAPVASAAGGVTASGADPTRQPPSSLIVPGMDPSLATAYRLAEQAGSEMDRGTTDRAIELSQRAIKLNDRAFPAYLVLARANVAEGLAPEARKVLARAAELQPDPVWLAEIVAQNGATWESEGKTEAAIGAYRRALAIYPANQTAREALARLVPR